MCTSVPALRFSRLAHCQMKFSVGLPRYEWTHFLAQLLLHHIPTMLKYHEDERD